MKRVVSILFASLVISTSADGQLVEKKVIVAPQFQHMIDTNKSMMLPAEYEINVFYADSSLKRPRFMALGPKNTIYVADMNANHIIALPDANHDGIADSAVIVSPIVDSSHSLAFYNGALYVAQPSRVRKFLDTDGDGFYETEEPFITGIGDTGYYNHYTRTIIFDTIGNHIYLSVGASCNACREGDSERATILQFNLDGTGRKIFATGLRNAIGLAIDEIGTLWAGNADRDGLGDNIPPEIITTVNDGDFFGWPFAYQPEQWVNFQTNQDYKSILPITLNDSIKVRNMQSNTQFSFPAHSTPMAIIAHNGYMLAALHGSSPAGRSVAVGYKVILGGYYGNLIGWQYSDFLTGFLTDSVHYTYWGRPCGLVQDSSGDIYLSSDQGIPAIYRIHLKKVNSVRSANASQTTITLFPNPASSTVTVSYSLPYFQFTKLELIDQLGRIVQLVREGYEEAGEKNISISLNGLPNGFYYLRMQTEAGIAIEKIILAK